MKDRKKETNNKKSRPNSIGRPTKNSLKVTLSLDGKKFTSFVDLQDK